MNKMWDLITNELKKIFASRTIWLIFLVMLAAVIGVAMLTASSDVIDTETTYKSDWQQQLQQQNKELASNKKLNPAHVKQTIEKNNYYLEHNIKPHHYQAGDFVIDNVFLTALVSLFTIVIAGGIVANEFTYGTIKQLLIRPVTRTTILASKYIAVILFSVLTMTVLFILTYVVGALFFGVSGLNPELVFERPDHFVHRHFLQEGLLVYGLKLVHILTLGTFGFMISSLLRSSSLAIGLSMFIMFLGSTASVFIAQYDWSKYLLFTNSDLSRYYHFIGPYRDDMTIQFSAGVTLIYLLVFLIVAWYSFVKRDIN
ncbi:ABC transporter permease [Macrococcus brunensis]|uniref:ABC transporter permease n=1 Tax=Macrococcus brunensis TaxID=198483 RepID=A0A4R6BBQ5_9STAP|nr:ABC transporter permease [Macrococcus brunensis]TDL95255.1 ABC transporter permease [Macrococcus brunensis]